MRTRPLIFDALWAAPAKQRPWVFDHGSDALGIEPGAIPLRELAISAGRLATAFEHRGLRPGDPCVVWLERPLDLLVEIAALTSIGVVPWLLSPALQPEMVERVLATAPPVKHFVTEAGRTDAARRITDVPVEDWAAVAREAAPLPPRREGLRLPSSAPYVVTHTSGTTGVNKLLQFDRRSASHNAATQEVPAALGRLRGYAAISFSPVHYRSVVGILCALRRRIPLIVLDSDDPASVAALVERWRPSYLEAHPNTFKTWEELAENGTFAPVKAFLSTFDVIHAGTVKKMLAGSDFPWATFWEIYGQSECSAITGRIHVKGFAGRLSGRKLDRRLKGHLVGRVLPGHAISRIVDEQGERVPAGVPGRILVRARGRFSAYPNRPESRRQNLRPDGWWDTGDWGYRDRLGRLTLIDRQVERLSAAPSAIALEDVLLDRMPWLLEAVVLERDGHLLPVVALRQGQLDTARWAAATSDLPDMLVPVVLEIGEIPRTATAKVQRGPLAALVERRASPPWVSSTAAGAAA